jgi:uncharacterized protein
MTIKETIEQDLKAAMLGGDKTLTTTLRGLKSAILYAEVAKGNREVGLSDEEITDLFTKEAKKRQESADLYTQGGNSERAEAELGEKAVIARYLPEQLSDDDLKAIIDEVVTSTGASGPQAMGQVIGAVKSKTAGSAEGAKIAQFVKERLG